MANTTNFNWETPDDTDLVKDGAAAIRTLGSAIDTSLVDLKGGTTDQVLAKNSNADMDFKWVADATGIPATIFDAKGDLIVASAADTAARLAVGGTNGHVLTVNSGATNGIEWAAPAAGGTRGLQQIIPTSVAVGSGTATVGTNGKITLSGVNTNLSVNGCFSSTYKNYCLVIDLKGDVADNVALDMRLRASGTDNTTASSYKTVSVQNTSGAISSSAFNTNYWYEISFMGNAAASGLVMNIYRPFLAENTVFSSDIHPATTGGTQYLWTAAGRHNQSTSYDGFSALFSAAVSGQVLIYGWSE